MAAGNAKFSRRQKGVLGIVAALALLLSGLAVCEWAGWPFLRQPVENQLSQKLQRKVELGDEFRVHLLGRLRISTDRISIAAPSWQAHRPDGPDFFSARDVRLALQAKR
ncbi:MAG: hypothetical protein ACRERR_00805 [Moraxellaceae bacterium]